MNLVIIAVDGIVIVIIFPARVADTQIGYKFQLMNRTPTFDASDKTVFLLLVGKLSNSIVIAFPFNME